ncbi:MAG: hypothetical protein HY769_03410 [Candidatus Stahlbacteria bacterium]|nr:hypothetical protein [Candidatus Stahlbacteria bacterium]
MKEVAEVKVNIVIKSCVQMIKVIEFYLNIDRHYSGGLQNKLMIVINELYELMVGNQETMGSFTGMSIRKDIENRKPVTLISSRESVSLADGALERFLLPIVDEEKIAESIKSSITLFAGVN